MKKKLLFVLAFVFVVACVEPVHEPEPTVEYKILVSPEGKYTIESPAFIGGRSGNVFDSPEEAKAWLVFWSRPPASDLYTWEEYEEEEK